MPNARYVVVSPMKNEAKHVSKTLKAMVAQSITPFEWLIVNDGSVDSSPEIVSNFSRQYPWIHMLTVGGLGKRRPEHYGGHVVDLIHDGLAHVEAKDYDFIVKLDCDISFEPNFFETILSVFEQNPTLGISSGISFIRKNGKLIEEKTAEGHTLGATKVYRRQCFEQIGGLVPSMGWDGIDEIKARMRGWEAWPTRELVFVHHRPEGTASGLFASGVERGKGSYFMGYHPVFMVARACVRTLKFGMLADAAGMLTGYFSSLVGRDQRIPDTEFIRYLRKNQIRKLLLLKSEV